MYNIEANRLKNGEDEYKFRISSLLHLAEPFAIKYPVLNRTMPSGMIYLIFFLTLIKPLETWEIKSVKVDTKKVASCGICADSSFLYIHNQFQGLCKIGKNGGTQQNHIVCQKPKYCLKETSQLAVTEQKLFLFSNEISGICRIRIRSFRLSAHIY